MPAGLTKTSRCQVTTVEKKLLNAIKKLIGEIEQASKVPGSGGMTENARIIELKNYCNLFMGVLIIPQEQSAVTVFFAQARNNKGIPQNIRTMMQKVYDDLQENHKGR